MTARIWPETVTTIYQGRAAIEAHPELGDALKALVETVQTVPNPARTRFLEYVRLVYGTTASISLPAEPDLDDAVALFRARTADTRLIVLDDVDDDSLGAAQHDSHDLARFELASDRPDRG